MEKKRDFYADGWHEKDSLSFFVEEGRLLRGVRGGVTVWPYQYDKKYDHYTNVSGIPARYGVLRKVIWR